MSGFDYSHTCPDIDREINLAKSHIADCLEEVVTELAPILCRIPSEDENDATFADSFIKEHSNTIYESIEGCFEAVRKTNEDMRAEANRQVEAMEEEIAELREQLAEYERGEAA